MTAGSWRDTGMQTAISGHQLAAAEANADTMATAAAATHRHLWVAVVGYLVVPPLVTPTTLDGDNLIIPPAVACYVCERPYTPGAERTRCPGEPGG